MLKKIDNYWVFPALLSAIIGALVIEKSLLLYLSLTVILVSLCCKRNKSLIVICLFCSFFVALRANSQKEKLQLPTEIGATNDYQLVLLPDSQRVNGDSLRFTAETIANQEVRQVTCRIKLKSAAEKDFWQANNQVLLLKTRGELAIAEGQRNLLGFDYRLYLASKGIAGILKVSDYQITKVIQPKFFDFQLFFSRLRQQQVQRIDKIFSRKTALYMKALLFGYQDQDFEEIREIYDDSGLLHLFSLSGLHVQFFLGSLYYLLRRLRLTPAESLGPLIVVSIFFYLLTGGSISVTRALIFFLVRRFLGLRRVVVSSLDRFSISLVLLLLVKPYTFFSLGGLLSVTISLFILLLQEKKSLNLVQKNLLLQIVMLPIVSYSFCKVPILSGFFSVLFIPLFEKIFLPYLSGLFIFSFFKFLQPLSLLPEIIFEKILQSMEWCISLFESWSLSASGFSNNLLVFLILIAIYFLQSQNLKKRAWLVIILAFPLYLKVINPFGMVAFVDVGQGDSIFLQAPFQKETILIDTGGQLTFAKEDWQIGNWRSAAEYNLIPFLQGQGVAQLDILVLTHADEDHIGEVLTLNQAIPVKKLYLAKGMEKNPKMKEILTVFQKQGTPIYLVAAGEVIGEKFQLQVLSPFTEVVGENNDSLVLWTTIAEHSFLFTGDLEAEGETQLINHYPQLQSEILKVGHHGSKTSTSKEFVQQLQPEIAIISCGKNNRFGHPHPKVLKNLQEVAIFRTDQQGMISFRWSFFQPMIIKEIIE